MITEPLGAQQVAFTEIYRSMLRNRISSHICSTTASEESAETLLEMMEAEVLRERERGNVAIAREEGKVLGMGLVALTPQPKPEPDQFGYVVLIDNSPLVSAVPFVSEEDATSWLSLNGLDGCQGISVVKVESPDEVSW